MSIFMRARKRLGFKLTVVLLALTLIPLTLIAYLTLRLSHRTLAEQQFVHLGSLAEQKATEVDRWLLDREQQLALAARQARVRDGVAALLEQDGNGADALAAGNGLLEDEVRPLLLDDGDFESIVLYGVLEGRVLARDDSEPGGLEEDAVERYVREAMAREGAQASAYAAALDGTSFVLGAPVVDSRGETVAVLVGKAASAHLNAIVEPRGDRPALEHLYLVNAGNQVVADSSVGEDGAGQADVGHDGVAECLQGRDGRLIYEDYRGVRVLGAFRWLAERELCVVAEANLASTFAPLNNLRASIVAMGALTMLGIVFASAYVSRSMTRPLRELVRGTERIGRGDLDYHIDVETHDELGQLTDAFNRMTRNLQSSTGEVAHGQQLLLALSQAAQTVQRAVTADEVFQTVGEEVLRLGYNPIILSVTEDQEHLRISYIGFEPSLIAAAEKLVGLSHKTYRFVIPRGGIYDRILKRNETVFLQPVSSFIAESLPRPVRMLASGLTSLMNMKEGIVAPLSVDGETMGVLIVTGEGLSEADASALKVFANQTAIALLSARRHEEVRQNEARFRAVFEGADTAMYLVKVAERGDYRYTAVNPALERLNSMKREDVLGKSPTALAPHIGGDAAERIVARYNRCVDEGAAIAYEEKVTIDGRETWWLSRLTPQRNADGEITQLVGTSVSITERKAAEAVLERSKEELEGLVAERTKELQTSEARFRAFFEAAPVPMLVSRLEDGVILRVNERVAETMGLPKEELIGAQAASFYQDPVERGAFVAALQREGKVHNFELGIQRRDGSKRWLLTSAVPIDYGEKPALLSTFVDVTERREMELALRHSEDRFRSLVQNASDVITIFDEKGVVTYDSPAIERMLGLDAEARVGKNVMGMAVAEDEEAVVEAFSELLKNPSQPVSMEVRVPDTRGEVHFLEVTATNLLDNPAVKGIVANFHDITDRVLAEEVLREREALWRTLFTESPIGIAIIDLNHRFQQVNPRLCYVSGYSEAELTGRSFADITHAEDLERELAMAERLVRAEIPSYAIEKRYIRKDGTHMWVQVTRSLVSDEDDQPQFVIAMIEDIDDRKEMETALRHNESLLRNVLEHLPVGVRITDDNGEVTQTNPAARSIWQGTAYEEGRHKNRAPKGWWRDSGKIVEPTAWAVYRALQTRETILNEEVEIECFDGSRKIILNSAIPLQTNGVMSGVVIVDQDVTSAKQLQAQLESNAKELERSNEELQQFAYVASHDLQEPLRMISSFLQLLQQRYGGQLDERADQYIHFAVDGATRMKRLINDLLHYSRVATQAKPLQPTHVQTIFDNVLGDLRLTIADHDATVTSDAFPTVMGDETQIRQLFQNLMSNALKFRGEAAPEIHVSVERQSNMWQFGVHDNGIGIESRFLERIFVIFQRLHRSEKYDGTGIGLAICKRIVRYHGGDIWVESTVGEGATFYFTLPAVREENDG